MTPDRLAAVLGAPVTATAPVGGGCTDDALRVDLDDGRRVFVKTRADRLPGAYETEARGLRWLAAAGAIAVPRPVAVADDLLALEWIDAGETTAAAGESLGRGLAALHRAGAPGFGLDHDNFIGPLPQDNTAGDDWADFYAVRRLAPYLDDLPAEVSARLRDAIDDGRLAHVLEHDVVPSLIHGDLWSGNIVGGRWLVDPAVNRADRELDLAMLSLFGSISDGFARGYAQVWPLDDGWQQRRPALQLYHLLVHVRLFGAGYVGGVVARLDALGW